MRVLGISNIANNAFKNAVILRKAGIECDVLCADYFHIMSCPEWELARFNASGIEQVMPAWSKIDLNGYERPRWFAQGWLKTCVEYLLAYRGATDDSRDPDKLWLQMRAEQEMHVAADTSVIRIAQLLKDEVGYDADIVKLALHLGKYLAILEPIKKLMACYDAIIGYANEGIMPLLAGVPYIAYEHGTIRNIPFDATLPGALCALVYKSAKHVLITNADCMASARKLGLERFSFIPHPILEHTPEPETVAALRSRLERIHDADFLVFHPARQHWSPERDTNWDKGNDVLIRSFAGFIERCPSAKPLLICVAWGEKQKESRDLMEQLGITDRVVWITPRPILAMLDYIAASDVLADQFTIGAFGAIVPLGLMLGKLTMAKIDVKMHAECFPEPPPVIDQEFFSDYENGMDEREWFQRYHSETVVLAGLKAAFEALA